MYDIALFQRQKQQKGKGLTLAEKVEDSAEGTKH